MIFDKHVSGHLLETHKMVRQKMRESIRFFIAESPLFINENESINASLAKMKKLNIPFLTVVKKDFTILGIIKKKDILKYLIQNPKNKNLNTSHLTKTNNETLLLYPMNTTFEALTTMKTLKQKVIPIANNPWEKKFVGVLWLNDINNCAEPAFS